MRLEKMVTTMPYSFQILLARLRNFNTLLALLLGVLAGFTIVLVNNPFFFLLGLAGIIVFLLSLYSEEFGLVVLIFISYSRLSDILIEYHGFISFAKPFVVVLVATIFVRWGIFGERPKGWERPAILFGLLSLTGLFSLFYSPVPDRVWSRWTDDIKDILIALIIVVLLQQGKSFRRVMWTLIAVGCFLGTLSTYQYLTGNFDNNYGGFALSLKHQIIGEIDDFRSTGPIGDPNFFAQIMVVIVPISLERFLHEKRLSRRLFALWTFLVSVLTVIFTYSRGGFLALVIAVFVLLVFYPPRRFQIPFLIFAAVLFISFLPPNYLDRLLALSELFETRTTLRTEDRSLQGRLSENLTALEMIKSNPLFGVGLSSYSYLFPTYSKKLGIALVSTEREAHNLYLESVAETGIIGLTVLLLVLFTCLQIMFNARKRFLRARMDNFAGMTTGFMAGWVGYLVAAMYIHNAFPRYFFLLLGIAMSLHMVAQNSVVLKPEMDGDL